MAIRPMHQMHHMHPMAMDKVLHGLAAMTCTLTLLLCLASANILPEEVARRPEPVQSTSMPMLQGKIPQRHSLMQKPRVVIGYVSASDWAFVEFITMTHASWRHMQPQTHGKLKLDILVFVHPRWAQQVQSICQAVDLDKDYGAVLQPGVSQCFAVSYAPPPADVWHEYPFINNVHFFADPRVQLLLKRHYGYAMKTDFDTFLSPAIINHFPNRFTFGIQEYVQLPRTGERLERISAGLGLSHQGTHNLGPTWYGDVASLISMANASIAVLYHIITKEFEQLQGGGLAQKWRNGEGWPEWSGGIAALYATEITANHMFADFEASDKYDVHGDSSLPLSEVFHIHCRHGDKDFNKFDFFKHHYDHVTDLSTFDLNVVKGYTSYLAISTWRELMKLTGGGQKPKTEL